MDHHRINIWCRAKNFGRPEYYSWSSKMNAARIENLLNWVLVGGNMCSLRVSGEWVALYFSACNVKNVTQVSIDTDAWVFVEEDENVADCKSIDETDFFGSRRSVLPKLYDLTGYDIESVSIVENNSLRILINNHVVTVCPRLIKATEFNCSETWRVVSSGDGGDQWLVKLEAQDLLVNFKHPLLHQ